MSGPETLEAIKFVTGLTAFVVLVSLFMYGTYKLMK